MGVLNLDYVYMKLISNSAKARTVSAHNLASPYLLFLRGDALIERT